MRVELNQNSCSVYKGDSDPKYYTESHLLYAIKQELNSQGHDLIKKRMWKDGHLMGDDTTQYIRTRSSKSARPHIWIYHASWQIESISELFNEFGHVVLNAGRDIFALPGRPQTAK